VISSRGRFRCFIISSLPSFSWLGSSKRGKPHEEKKRDYCPSKNGWPSSGHTTVAYYGLEQFTIRQAAAGDGEKRQWAKVYHWSQSHHQIIVARASTLRGRLPLVLPFQNESLKCNCIPKLMTRRRREGGVKSKATNREGSGNLEKGKQVSLALLFFFDVSCHRTDE